MALNYRIIGSRIRFFRRQRNLSQGDIAERIEKSPSYISYLETGSKHASLETLVDIANILRISTDMLLADNLRVDKQHAFSLHSGEEFQQLLSDCSQRDQRILLETAKELKRILSENSESEVE